MPLTSTTGLTSIIVPTRNQVSLLKALTASLIRTLSNHRVELLIVDNGSSDPATCEWLARAPDEFTGSPLEPVEVIRDPSPFNYSKLNNRGASCARGEFLCLLNDDIEAISDTDWLTPLLDLACMPDVGCVGAKLLYPDDTLQHAGVMLGMGPVAGHPFKGLARDDPGPGGVLTQARQVSAVTGACMVLRRSVFEQIGGFEEQLPVVWNDVDLCLRVAAEGYRCMYNPDAVLRHHESISRHSKRKPKRIDRQRFANDVRFMQIRWGDKLQSDQFMDHLPQSIRHPFVPRAENETRLLPRIAARLKGS